MLGPRLGFRSSRMLAFVPSSFRHCHKQDTPGKATVSG